METKELTCIGCPMGCSLVATITDTGITVTGNTCRIGENYAKEELTNPTRIVTTTVRVKDGNLPQVSCKTKEAIPKGKIRECMKELAKVTVDAPVAMGEVLLANVAGTGIPVIATKKIEKR